MFIDDNEGLQAMSIEQSGLDSKMRQHVRACCIQLQSEDFINQGKRTSSSNQALTLANTLASLNLFELEHFRPHGGSKVEPSCRWHVAHSLLTPS